MPSKSAILAVVAAFFVARGLAQEKTAKHIEGKLYLVQRNEKGEWVRREQETKKDAPPAKKAEPAKEKGKPETETEKGFGEIAKAIAPFREAQENSYRKFIPGESNEAAVWEFKRLPPELAQRDEVALNFAGDIFRVTKGVPDRATIDITLINHSRWNEGRAESYRKAKEAKSAKPLSAEELAREFGRHEITGLEIRDDPKRPNRITVPGGLLKDLKEGTLEIRVECKTRGVFLGFGQEDLYIVEP
jgi:hypothetical protein